jgi:hypothetical protein
MDSNKDNTPLDQEIGVLTASTAKGNEELEKEIELTYQPIVLVAGSTVNGYMNGLRSMDLFCTLQGIKKMSEYKATDFDDPKVCANLIFDFKCFCSFLLHAQSNNGKHYMPGSQKQMLGNVFNYLHKAHPAVKMFDQEKYPVESKWYTDIQKSLQRNGFNNAIDRGESVGDKAAGIRHALLEDIIRNLIKEARYKEASAVCTLYHAVGRGGEVSAMTFTSMKWDSTLESLWAGWPEIKTSHYTDLSFFANVLSYGYLTCFMWTFGAYIIMTEGRLRSRANTPDFVFPDYQEKRTSAAVAVTKAIASLVGKVTGLLKMHTSHGLRVGATDDMLFNVFCHIACAIARGAWDCRGMCMILSYYTKNLFVSTAGKALAGVKDCRQHHSMPTLAALPDDARDKVNHMAELLFYWGPDVFRAECNGHLLPARDALLATQLMWFKHVVLDYGQEHSLVKMLTEKATVAHVSFEDLEEYGTLIRLRYQADMIKNQQNTGSCLASLRESIKTLTNMLNHQVAKLRAVVTNLTGEVQMANAKLDAQDAKIEKLQQQNATLTSTVIDIHNILVRYVKSGSIDNDEMVHAMITNTTAATNTTTLAKRGRVSLDSDASCDSMAINTTNNNHVIDLSQDDSKSQQDNSEKQQPRTKIQKLSKTTQQPTLSLFFLPKTTACPTMTACSMTMARPTVTTTTAAHPTMALPMTARLSTVTHPTTTARPMMTARPAMTMACPSSFSREWKDSMASSLTEFLIKCSMHSFRAFCDSKELGDLPKQVKSKLKEVFNYAWNLANAQQKEIMNRPRVSEANRYQFPGYLMTLSTVCDDLASNVFAIVVVANPLPPPVTQANGTKKKKPDKAPSSYKHLKVSYTYNRLQMIKKGETVAAVVTVVDEQEEKEEEEE